MREMWFKPRGLQSMTKEGRGSSSPPKAKNSSPGVKAGEELVAEAPACLCTSCGHAGAAGDVPEMLALQPPSWGSMGCPTPCCPLALLILIFIPCLCYSHALWPPHNPLRLPSHHFMSSGVLSYPLLLKEHLQCLSLLFSPSLSQCAHGLS